MNNNKSGIKVRVKPSKTSSVGSGGPPLPGTISKPPSSSSDLPPPPTTIPVPSPIPVSVPPTVPVQNPPVSSPPMHNTAKPPMAQFMNPAQPRSVPIPTLVPPSPVAQDPKDMIRLFAKGPNPDASSEIAASSEAPLSAPAPSTATEPSPSKANAMPSRFIPMKISTNLPADASGDDTYKEVLNSPTMRGFNPKVSDQVFTLEKYPGDAIQAQSRSSKNEPVTAKGKESNGSSEINSQNKAERVVKTSSNAKSSAPASASEPKENLIEYDNSYSFFEKMLVFINMIIFIGILFTCYVFIKIYTRLHPEEVGRLIEVAFRSILQFSAQLDQWVQNAVKMYQSLVKA